jgi:hypothetical protein
MSDQGFLVKYIYMIFLTLEGVETIKPDRIGHS